MGLSATTVSGGDALRRGRCRKYAVEILKYPNVSVISLFSPNTQVEPEALCKVMGMSFH